MMMKLLASLALIVSTSALDLYDTPFGADTKAGEKLINSARKLEDGFNAEISGYSILYAGCHNSTSWGDDGYQKIGLVRFILCPSNYCSADGGCSSSASGEYLVDMLTFVDAYLEAKLEAQRYKCEKMREVCGCDEESSGYCLYHCYMDYDSSVDWLACDVDEEDENENMGECQALEIDNDDDDGGRRLGNDDGVAYFQGPYCGPGGDNIFMTLFSEETCSTPIANGPSVYYSLTKRVMKYSKASGMGGMVTKDCISCQEVNYNDDDQQDADDVMNICEETYEIAAKCETNMAIAYPVTTGCSFIYNLQTYDGSIGYMSTWKNTSTSTAGFALLGCAVALVVGAALVMFQKKKRARGPLLSVQ